MNEEIERLIQEVVQQAIQLGHQEAQGIKARSDRAALRHCEITARLRAELEVKRVNLTEAIQRNAARAALAKVKAK